MTQELVNQTAKILSYGVTNNHYKAYFKALSIIEPKHKKIKFTLPRITTRDIIWLGFGNPPPGVNAI